MIARPAHRDAVARRFDLVAGRDRSRPRVRPWIVFALFVVVAFFGLIASRISLDRSAFLIEELESQIEGAEAHHWDLRLEVARLQDPARVAAAARDMGLVFPDDRHELDVAPTAESELDPEYRWAQLKALLSAHR